MYDESLLTAVLDTALPQLQLFNQQNLSNLVLFCRPAQRHPLPAAAYLGTDIPHDMPDHLLLRSRPYCSTRSAGVHCQAGLSMPAPSNKSGLQAWTLAKQRHESLEVMTGIALHLEVRLPRCPPYCEDCLTLSQHRKPPAVVGLELRVVAAAQMLDC